MFVIIENDKEKTLDTLHTKLLDMQWLPNGRLSVTSWRCPRFCPGLVHPWVFSWTSYLSGFCFKTDFKHRSNPNSTKQTPNCTLLVSARSWKSDIRVDIMLKVIYSKGYLNFLHFKLCKKQKSCTESPSLGPFRASCGSVQEVPSFPPPAIDRFPSPDAQFKTLNSCISIAASRPVRPWGT